MTGILLITGLGVLTYACWSWAHRHTVPSWELSGGGAEPVVTAGELRSGANPKGPRARSIEAALVATATAMRSGATGEAAWRDHAGIQTDPDRLPLRDELVEIGIGQGLPKAIAHTHAADIVAACRLADTTGAPLAEVLDDVRSALDDLELARTERFTAMAGPRMTARVLVVMPVIGILFGLALGVDPIAVFLDGGFGTACLILAVGLCAAGWAWTRKLIRRAEDGGDIA